MGYNLNGLVAPDEPEFIKLAELPRLNNSGIYRATVVSAIMAEKKTKAGVTPCVNFQCLAEDAQGGRFAASFKTDLEGRFAFQTANLMTVAHLTDAGGNLIELNPTSVTKQDGTPMQVFRALENAAFIVALKRAGEGTSGIPYFNAEGFFECGTKRSAMEMRSGAAANWIQKAVKSCVSEGLPPLPPRQQPAPAAYDGGYGAPAPAYAPPPAPAAPAYAPQVPQAAPAQNQVQAAPAAPAVDAAPAQDFDPIPF